MYKRKATLRQPWLASRVIGRAGGRDKQNCSAFFYKTTSLAIKLTGFETGRKLQPVCTSICAHERAPS